MLTIELTPTQYAHFLQQKKQEESRICDSCGVKHNGNPLAREYGNSLICDACMESGLKENMHSDEGHPGEVADCADCASHF